MLRGAPAVPGLSAADIPALLTRHYARLVSARLRGSSLTTFAANDQWPPQRIADVYEIVASLGEDRPARIAAAFVAATAHQVMASANATGAVGELGGATVSRDSVDSSLAAALLFLLAEQYADAYEAARTIPSAGAADRSAAALLAENIASLARGQLRAILARAESRSTTFPSELDIEAGALSALLGALNDGVELLASEVLDESGIVGARARFQSSAEAFNTVLGLSQGEEARIGETVFPHSSYPGPAHLAALLLAASDSISGAALVRLAPPDGAEGRYWKRWIRFRAERAPFLWPNHRTAVDRGFLSLGSSAVLVLPTGAGKTTVSSLKIAATLARGQKVIFLAPTHALVEQLVDDLQQMFPQDLTGSAVSSDFDSLFQTGRELRDIEVMTPERCLAMLSFAPEAFANLGLLVFDECHLLAPYGDRVRRSMDAMLCLLGLVRVAPSADLLFLSAMLKEAEAFSDWVAALTGRTCLCVDLLWKPSRQARGVLIYSDADVASAEKRALSIQRQIDKQTGKRAKGLRSKAAEHLALPAYALWGLQHNWLQEDSLRCSIRAVLDTPVLLTGQLGRGTIRLKPNANHVASRVAVSAVKVGLKAIVFVNTKDDALSVARSISAELPTAERLTALEPERWSALETELGGLMHSVLSPDAAAVPHNASMIRLERDLAERLYRHPRGAAAIVATPTLAQGLNLPAHIAILAGDKRADSTGTGRSELEAHELLNAAARAGRAGHVANGVVLLIPEPPITFEAKEKALGPVAMQKLKSILPDDDRCVAISDPLQLILDRLSEGTELDADSRYLVSRMMGFRATGQDGSPAAPFDIRRSLGAFVARIEGSEERFERGVLALSAAVDNALASVSDERVASLASLTGLPLDVLERLLGRLSAGDAALPDSIDAWIDWTFSWLDSDVEARSSLLGDLSGSVRASCGLSRSGAVSAAELRIVAAGLRAWVHGAPLSQIETALGGNPFAGPSSASLCPRARELVGTVIPRGISFIVSIVSHLARTTVDGAGQQDLVRDTLDVLATCVRRGFDSADMLRFANDNPSVLSRVQLHRLYHQAGAQ